MTSISRMTKRSILTTLLTPIFLFSALSLSSCGGEDQRAWQAIKSDPSIQGIDDFLLKYPDSGHRKAALEQKEDLIWNFANSDNTEYAFRKYKYDYPEGKYADQVDNKIAAIGADAEITLETLTQKTFVGVIRYNNAKDVPVLALKFTQIEEAEGEIRFQAAINTNDMRTDVLGTIQKPLYKISFDENALNLSTGRAYFREGRVLLESTDVEQLWRIY